MILKKNNIFNMNLLYNKVEKYKNDIKVSIIFDKDMLTNYKDSPIDCGPDIFMELFKERIMI